MIHVSKLAFRYRGQRHNVLDGIDLDVADGEIVAIVGRNGSGKSTLGKIIAGLTNFKAGAVMIDELDLGARSTRAAARQKIGIVFQNPDNQIIFPNIRDELSFTFADQSTSQPTSQPASQSADQSADQQLDQRIDSALAAVDMLDHKSRNLYELSLGQKQRIMIAEVLAKGSRNLVFDEPTTMIDSTGKEQIHQILRDLRARGHAILLLTNLADEILLADRTLILEHGRLVASIARADLPTKTAVLRAHGITLPTLLQLTDALQQRGLQLPLRELTVSELADQLVESRRV